MPKKTLHKLLITGAVALLGVGFLVYSSLANAGRYRMVDKLMAAPTDFVGKKLQVHGWVEPGSIKEWIDHQETVRTFVLEKNGKRIMVEHRGPAPDTFKDRIRGRGDWPAGGARRPVRSGSEGAVGEVPLEVRGCTVEQGTGDPAGVSLTRRPRPAAAGPGAGVIP